MGRKKNPQKPPISNKIRARMHRQRKNLKNSFRKREQQVLLNNNGHIHIAQPENSLSENESVESPIKTRIRDWANMHRVSKRALDDLLAILVASGIDSVPKNHRTLQKTPTNIEIINVGGGHFWFNGLKKCIGQIFSNLDRDIKISLNFNIDGLPLYKSSTITFYPILAAIHGMHKKKIKVISMN